MADVLSTRHKLELTAMLAMTSVSAIASRPCSGMLPIPQSVPIQLVVHPTKLANGPNYTTGGACSSIPNDNLVENGEDGSDPIALSSLLYENTYRLFEMGSDYFSLVQPFYFFTSIPEQTGYHVYSFALEPEAMDPSASTNFGKLTNVSLQLTPSADAVNAAQALDQAGQPTDAVDQQFQVFIRALNFNIVRVSG